MSPYYLFITIISIVLGLNYFLTVQKTKKFDWNVLWLFISSFCLLASVIVGSLILCFEQNNDVAKQVKDGAIVFFILWFSVYVGTDLKDKQMGV